MRARPLGGAPPPYQQPTRQAQAPALSAAPTPCQHGGARARRPARTTLRHYQWVFTISHTRTNPYSSGQCITLVLDSDRSTSVLVALATSCERRAYFVYLHKGVLVVARHLLAHNQPSRVGQVRVEHFSSEISQVVAYLSIGRESVTKYVTQPAHVKYKYVTRYEYLIDHEHQHISLRYLQWSWKDIEKNTLL